MKNNYAQIKAKDDKFQLACSDIRDAMINGGDISVKGEPLFTENNERARITLEDFITEPDLKPFTKHVISTIVMEAIQPALMIVDNLFATINVGVVSEIFNIQTVQEINVGPVSQGGDYPVANLSFAETDNAIQTKIQKIGAQLLVAKDVIKSNQIGLTTMWLRLAGRALAKYKENLAIKYLAQQGVVVFDNTSPSTSTFGTTTGRGIDGKANGSFTINDFQNMYVYGMMRGLNLDTLVVHPLAWRVLSLDSKMSEVILKNSKVIAPNNFPIGKGAAGFPDPFRGRGLRTFGTGNVGEGVNAYTNNLTGTNASFYTMPAGDALPTPVKVLVSHLVPYRVITTPGQPDQYVTSILMADSAQCGILYQKGGVTTYEIANENDDRPYNLKISEEYGFGMFAQGKGIIEAKNIVVDQNYQFGNTNSVSLDPINTKTPIVV